MSTSTLTTIIAPPTAAAAKVAAPVRPEELIRSIARVTVPAALPWGAAPGQRLGFRGDGLRKRARCAQVAGGRLDVTDQLLGTTLDLTVRVVETGMTLTIAARVTRLDAIDSWHAVGVATSVDGNRPVSLRLRSNGVFRQRGRTPSLWVTVIGDVELPEADGRRRARRWHLRAELNFHAGEAR